MNSARNIPLSRRHIGVMLWLLENPTATLTECAKVLGYSRPWLSRIVNAPQFRACYRDLLAEHASRLALQSIEKFVKHNNFHEVSFEDGPNQLCQP